MVNSPLRQRLAGSIAVAGVLLSACAQDTAVAPDQTMKIRTPTAFVQSDARPDRYLVSFAATEPGTFAAAVQALGGKVERRHAELNLAIVEGVGAGGAESLSRAKGVELVAQDLQVQFVPRPDAATVHQFTLASARIAARRH